MCEFTVHPLRRNLPRSLLAALGLAGVMLLFYFALGRSIPASLGAGLFLFLSLSSFFLPTSYTFSEETVTIRRPFLQRTLSLKHFRGYSLEKNGIFLSPFADRRRFDNFRGTFLIMDADEQKKVAPLIEKAIAGG
jgi:hypothetical protein